MTVLSWLTLEVVSDGSREANSETVDDLLGSSTELLQIVVDSALAAVVVMNDRGAIVGWGRRATATFGFSRSEALGRPLVDLIVPERYREAHNRGLARYRETGEGPVLGQVIELSALHADGHEFPAEIAISPAAVVAGRTTFIAFLRDITERKEAERRQVELYAYAADATKALRDFASLAVHELRTPLAVAGGYTSMLLDGSMGPPSDAWTSSLDIVQEKLREAGRLVDDLLVTSRIEGGALQPRLSPVVLDDLLRAAIDRAEKRARVVGSAVTLKSTAHNVRVMADPEMCAKIIDNLLNNAIGHAGKGATIEARIRQDPRPAVTVADDGPGIPEGLHARIFERFFRAGQPALESGSGLGLYLSRELAELQGGRLELDWSRPGEGSSFTLSFPGAAGD